jgi:hypothetical protein
VYNKIDPNFHTQQHPNTTKSQLQHTTTVKHNKIPTSAHNKISTPAHNSIHTHPLQTKAFTQTTFTDIRLAIVEKAMMLLIDSGFYNRKSLMSAKNNLVRANTYTQTHPK